MFTGYVTVKHFDEFFIFYGELLSFKKRRNEKKRRKTLFCFCAPAK